MLLKLNRHFLILLYFFVSFNQNTFMFKMLEISCFNFPKCLIEWLFVAFKAVREKDTHAKQVFLRSVFAVLVPGLLFNIFENPISYLIG